MAKSQGAGEKGQQFPVTRFEVERKLLGIIEQIEKLAYTKNRDMALELKGWVDCLVWAGNFRREAFKERMNNALKLVMAERKGPEIVQSDATELLGAPPEVGVEGAGTPPASGGGAPVI